MSVKTSRVTLTAFASKYDSYFFPILRRHLLFHFKRTDLGLTYRPTNSFFTEARLVLPLPGCFAVVCSCLADRGFTRTLAAARALSKASGSFWGLQLTARSSMKARAWGFPWPT